MAFIPILIFILNLMLFAASGFEAFKQHLEHYLMVSSRQMRWTWGLIPPSTKSRTWYLKVSYGSAHHEQVPHRFHVVTVVTVVSPVA